MESIAVMTTLLGFLLAVVTIARTLIESGRAKRIAELDSELHTKVLDRFNSAEEALSYLESPQGLALVRNTAHQSSLASRKILTSIQVGIVLVALGVGFMLLTLTLSDPNSAEGVAVFGTLATALGVGFLASAIAALLVSRRLGLLEPKVDVTS